MITEVERKPTASELALWDKARIKARRVSLLLYACQLQLQNLYQASLFAKENGVSIPEFPTELETHFLNLKKEAASILTAQRDVENNVLAVQFNNGDIDIVDPSQQFGAVWIPIAIGAVVVAGIIARWAYLEKETDKLEKQYNGLLRHTDNELCADPTSATCEKWKEKKKSGGYYKRTTIVEDIKDSIGSAVTTAKTGLGVGVVAIIAIVAVGLFLKARG